MKIKPKLKTKNINQEYLKVAKEYISEISKNKGVIGVAVGGGLGRGHSDTHSDIDIYVYLDSKTYNKWKKKAPIKEKCHRWNGYKMETYFINYEDEIKSNDWCVEDRWERQHHFTIFDTKNKITNLLNKKCVWEKGEKEKLLQERLKRTDWYIELPEDFVKRGDIGQAHYLLNVVTDWILDVVLLKNNYFIPWAKWKFHYAVLMKKKPKNFERRIKEAMKIKSFDSKDVYRRIRITDKIFQELK